jgi:hypothetical protein
MQVAAGDRNPANNRGVHMSISENKDSQENSGIAQDGELSDQELDGVSGGQAEIVKLDPIIVTAKRSQAAQPVVKLDPVVVTAKREQPNIAGAQVASAGGTIKKN